MAQAMPSTAVATVQVLVFLGFFYLSVRSLMDFSYWFVLWITMATGVLMWVVLPLGRRPLPK